MHKAQTSAIAKVLLDNKAKIDEENDKGLTPLRLIISRKVYSLACNQAKLAIVKLLIARGADITR